MHHPDYSVLAARVLVSKIYKTTVKSFSRWVNTYGTGMYTCRLRLVLLQSFAGPRAILRPEFVAAVSRHAAELDEAVLHARDRGFYLYALASLFTPFSYHQSPFV